MLTTHSARVFASSRADVDQILARPYNNEVPFGSVGDRIWAVSPQGWGFDAGVQLNQLRTDINAFDVAVSSGGGVPIEVESAISHPSHVEMNGAPDAPLRARGVKWIAQNDVLVTRLQIENRGETARPFHIAMSSGLEKNEDGEWTGAFDMGGDLWLYMAATGFDGSERATDYSGEIAPGETRVWLLAAAVGADSDEAQRNLESVFGAEDAFAAHLESCRDWFDTNTAYFACSDAATSKMYWHRWHLLRRCGLNPRLGAMQHRTFCEGRWHSPWYPFTISYGAPHQIREARWLRDPDIVWGHIQTWTENTRADGLFPGRIAPEGELGWQYAEWITSTAWDAYQVHPQREILARAADKLVGSALAWKEIYGWNDSPLLVVDHHFWTGMEWQPSFFAFRDYQTTGGDSEGGDGDPLRRVDLSAYNFGNARAAAHMLREVGRAEAATALQGLADATQKALLAQMWNPPTSWFHSLRASDNALAPDKEIVGIYPFYFGLPPANEGYEAAWSVALDPNLFWTKHPLATVAQDSSAFSQSGWPVGEGGSVCMWNGPSWPHTNSIVLGAMANTLRHYAPCALTRQTLFDLFNDFTRVQYKDGDFGNPWTGEFYNGDTGAWLTPERDYLHSTWIDPLITDLIGLVPRIDEILEIDSLLPDGAWDWWVLDGQQYRGHDVTIAYDAKGGNIAPDFRGFAVYLDGAEIFHAEALTRVRFDMKLGRVAEQDENSL